MPVGEHIPVEPRPAQRPASFVYWPIRAQGVRQLGAVRAAVLLPLLLLPAPLKILLPRLLFPRAVFRRALQLFFG